jgi:uncharacterized membrane protein YphA (DoxX/SURF4 family)
MERPPLAGRIRGDAVIKNPSPHTPAGWGLLVVRLGLAAVFVAAAIPKITAPAAFAVAISNYKMLPPWGVNALALTLPWLELLIGVFLALGIWRRACALVMAVLMVVFMIGFGSATARGLDIACGCFEVGENAPASSPVRVVARDLALLTASLLLLRFDFGPRPLDGLRRRNPAIP